jgi:hypothetical protein
MRSNIITKADRPDILITKHLNEKRALLYNNARRIIISISILTRQEKI